MKEVAAFKDESFISSSQNHIIKLDFQLSKVNYYGGTTTDVLSTWDKLNKALLAEERFGGYIKKSKHKFKKIAEVMQTYSSPSKMLSFVDASLIFFGKQLEIDEILSFDHHFDGIFRRIQ